MRNKWKRFGYAGGRDGAAIVGRKYGVSIDWGPPVWWWPRGQVGAISESGHIRGVRFGWLLVAIGIGKRVETPQAKPKNDAPAIVNVRDLTPEEQKRVWEETGPW